MVTLTEAKYRDKVYGGWLGKLIGMSAGAPMDGQKQSHDMDLSVIESTPRNRPDPGPSLDFQLVWLRTLHTVGPRLTSDDLCGAWLRHLVCADGECAHAVCNFRRGLCPPLSGAFDNPYRNTLGAFARADLWGLVVPGDPRQAVQYARQDAMLDHAEAGIEAAGVIAAMVSAAFVESEPARLVEIALGLIPGECRVARAIRDVARWHGELAQWSRTREMLLRAHGSEDVRDGVVAAALTALALVHERGDLGRTLLTAARCGWSTQATCGAAGAVLGVVLGASGIPARLRDIVVDDLHPGWGVVGLGASLSAAALTEQTVEAGRLVIRSELAGRVQLVDDSPEEQSVLAAPDASGLIRQMAMGSYVSSFRKGPLEVSIDYDTRPTIGYDSPCRLAIGIANAGARSLDLRARISAPVGFTVTTQSERITLPEGSSVSFMAAFSAPEEHARIGAANPLTLFVSLEDLTEMTFPISLVGESLWHVAGPYGSFDEAHAPEQAGILSGETLLGGEGWRRLSVPEPAVNLLAGMEGEQGTYYLATDYYMPRARAARLRIGCNDGAKVWLGGREIHSQHEHRPVSPSSADEFDAELWQGWNRLVIKMAQCSPRRFLSVVWKSPDQQILLEAVNTFPRS
jgi:hypothetical protein